MANHDLGVFSADSAADAAALVDERAVAAPRPGSNDANAGDAGLPAPAEPDQLARDIAAIERATAALRKAEPTLESWSDPPPQASHKPRPIWLLVGALWISTAIVTVGAAVAIAALVG
ncbi:MAG: hypothetical protein WBF03_19550 [Xanthobacteraceae bacterium]